MPVLAVAALPGEPLAAAQAFHAEVLPQLLAQPADVAALTLLLPPLPHEQHGWLQAALQSLARARAPQRINAVAGEDPAREELARWLEDAAAVTGQLIHADGAGSPAVLD